MLCPFVTPPFYLSWSLAESWMISSNHWFAFCHYVLVWVFFRTLHKWNHGMDRFFCLIHWLRPLVWYWLGVVRAESLSCCWCWGESNQSFTLSCWFFSYIIFKEVLFYFLFDKRVFLLIRIDTGFVKYFFSIYWGDRVSSLKGCSTLTWMLNQLACIPR